MNDMNTDVTPTSQISVFYNK